MPSRFNARTFTDSDRRTQIDTYGRSQSADLEASRDPLGPMERAFIQQRDSFYMATVSESGWPYVQHRGGRPGFVEVLGNNRIAFLDLSGNRQLISAGNLAVCDRVALNFFDYPVRTWLKLLEHATTVLPAQAPELTERLRPATLPPSQVERIVEIRVEALDWNCPKHITPRYTRPEMDRNIAPLRRRIAELESRIHELNTAAH